jgi:phage shock protein E
MSFLVTVGCAKDSAPIDPETKNWLTHVNAKQAKQLLDKKPAPLVLDIRTPYELKSGTIPGAFPANYYHKDFEQRISKIDRKQPILLHCRSGGRSKESLEIFKKLGFQTIYHLDGGILAWQKEGFPIEKK